MQGGRYCEYCGRPIKPGDWQCPGCGAAVEYKEEPKEPKQEESKEEKYKQATEKQYYEKTYEEQKRQYYDASNSYDSYYQQGQGYTTQEQLFKRYGLSRNAYGGLIARTVAYMIDMMIVGIIGCIPVVGVIGAILYVILGDSEKWDGQTIGKRVMGLKVVNLDYETISVGSSIWRNICKIISLSLFGYLTIIISGRKRSLHDFLSGTCVIKTR